LILVAWIKLLLVPVAGGPVQTPYDLLVTAIDNDSRVQYSAVRRVVMYQSTGPLEIKMSCEQNAQGSTRSVILSPTRFKGSVVVDNGKIHVRFEPRTNRCQVQPSSVQLMRAIASKRRLSLIKSNYVVTLGTSGTVAGRKALVLEVKPRKQGGLRRTYWVDAVKKLPLKMQVSSNSGELLLLAELQFPDFAKAIPADTFRTNFGPGIKLENLPHSEVFTTLSKLQTYVGFDVLAPDRLPMGMTFLCGEALRANDRQAAALRYTDGLSFVSVFQVPSSTIISSYTTCQGQERSAVFNQRGSKYTIVGDIGAEGMTQFVGAFERADKDRQNKWAAQLAQKLGVSQSSVRGLFDRGYDVEETAFMAVVMKQTRRSLDELRAWRAAGLSREQIIRRSNADAQRVEQLVRTVCSTKH